MTLLILGALMLARHLLWEEGSVAPSREHPSKNHPGPPVLPGILEPKAPEKEATKPTPAKDPGERTIEAPTPSEPAVSPRTNASLPQGKVRVLPPIQAEPDEEELVEFPFAVEPEPLLDEPEEDPPSPPMAPEPGPEFVR